MRILFHSFAPIRRELGAAKVLIELGESLEELGCHCEFISQEQLLKGKTFEPIEGLRKYQEAVRDHLQKHASEFDVVDLDQASLPFSRKLFPAKTLLVARSVLLVLHMAAVHFPLLRHWKHGLSQWKSRFVKNEYQDFLIQESMATFGNCDLINVANSFDETELVKRGIPIGKIAVLPYGLHQARRNLLLGSARGNLEHPVIVFIGTFDSRKGGGDMPAIFRELTRRIPAVRFLLLGTKGLLATEQEVLNCFPRGLRTRIQVVPNYKTEELPKLLKDCVLGVFPSYVEGFGFGVLEMMTAGLPVFAYRAPGPPEMLPDKYLVESGQTTEIASRMADLLQSSREYQKAREELVERSARFNWRDIAAETITRYEAELAKLGAL